MISNVMDKIYSFLALITILLGVVTAIMFTLSLAIGGGTGEFVAILAGKIMTWGIRLAAVATLAGIIKIYLNKQHTLTIDVEKVGEEEVTPLQPAEGTAV